MKPLLNALVIEPNVDLLTPYYYLNESYSIIRRNSARDGIKAYLTNSIDIVFISASLTPNRSLAILDSIKTKTKVKLIPVVFVIDYTNPLNFIPGTTWGGKIGILDSFTNEAQFVVVIDRILRLML